MTRIHSFATPQATEQLKKHFAQLEALKCYPAGGWHLRIPSPTQVPSWEVQGTRVFPCHPPTHRGKMRRRSETEWCCTLQRANCPDTLWTFIQQLKKDIFFNYSGKRAWWGIAGQPQKGAPVNHCTSAALRSTDQGQIRTGRMYLMLCNVTLYCCVQVSIPSTQRVPPKFLTILFLLLQKMSLLYVVLLVSGTLFD